ncbi:TPA: hypothetical protein ACJGL8_004639 [Salmonella enterica subsp. enterica]
MADERHPAVQTETVAENREAVVTGCGGVGADYGRLVVVTVDELENDVLVAFLKVNNREELS